MTLPVLLSMALSVLLIENFVPAQLLGVRPLLDGTDRLPAAACMGVAVTAMLILSSLLTWPVEVYLLAPMGAALLRPAVFLLLIVGLERLLQWASARWLPPLHRAMGKHLPVATANSALLGAALLYADGARTLAETLALSALSGVGFTAVGLLLAGVRERLVPANIPGAFRGVPIALVTLGLIALAFMGFAGLSIG